MKLKMLFLIVVIGILGSVSADFGINNEEGPFSHDRIWHMFIFFVSTFKNMRCVWMGLYGVAVFNDNGIMAE